ncbi:MAG: hypothetical protein AB1938_28745 [Myxococcota bacterium]
MWDARWVVLGLAVCGCQRAALPPPPAPPPPPAVAVPEGCLADLSGDWVHEEDDSFRYRGEDDGGVLTLTVTRVEAPGTRFRPRRFRDAGLEVRGAAFDAGPAEEVPDAGLTAVVLTLARTPHGFVGETRLHLRHPGGRACEAVFPAEVADCRDGGLTLSAVPAVTFGADCQTPPGPAPSPHRHTLRRP